MLRSIAAVAALVLSAAAFSQTASQQVQLLAPQLVPFTGSTGNFDSLVNGLTLGTPVTLTTVTADGLVQIVTFMPGITLSALDAARALETARQNLITRGVTTPNAQQLAVALMGGSLQAPSGISPLTGALTGTTGTSSAIQVRNELATGSTLGTGTTSNLSAANLLALRTALAQGTALTLTSTTPTGASQVVTFTPPGGPMSAFEVNQALQLASALLAQQGILNPTVDQLRVALLGGTLVGVNGVSVPVQGVLQGRLRATSDSPLVSTSNSPFFGTSNSPVVGTSNTPAAVNPAAAGIVFVPRVPAMPIRPGGG